MRIFIAVCTAVFILSWAYPAWAQTHTQIDKLTIITMDEAIARVLEASPIVNASYDNIIASNGMTQQARTRPNPELSMVVENLAGSGNFSGIDRAEVTLSIGQQFERGNKRNARIALAEANRNLAKLTSSITENDVIFTARQTYIHVLIASLELINAERRANAANELALSVKQRVESAKDSVAALERVAARSLEAKADVDQAKFALDIAKQYLSSLWGGSGTNFQIDQSFLYNIQSFDNSVVQGQKGKVLELLLASENENRASAALLLERANAKQDPTIRFGIRQFQQSNDVAAILSFSMPLTFFDKNRGNINRAAAEKSRSKWLSRDLEMKFNRDLMVSKANHSSALAEVATFRDKIIPKAQSALDATRTGYDRGAFTYLEVLAAQQTLYGFQFREITALKRFHIANATIDRLLTTYQGSLLAEEN